MQHSPLSTDKQRVDYAATREYKNQFLQRYATVARELIVQDPAYTEFVKQAAWLKGYAVFKALKSHFMWSDWESWSEASSPANLDSLAERYHRSRVAVHFTVSV